MLVHDGRAVPRRVPTGRGHLEAYVERQRGGETAREAFGPLAPTRTGSYGSLDEGDVTGSARILAALGGRLRARDRRCS